MRDLKSSYSSLIHRKAGMISNQAQRGVRKCCAMLLGELVAATCAVLIGGIFVTYLAQRMK